MADHEIVEQCKKDMEKAIKAFDNDLAKVRTGRASIALLDGLKVDYYGNPTLLNQVATLTTPDARMIVVAPFEKKMIQAIEKSIMAADLGVTPNNDGNVVRLPIPPLTEERRKDIVKNVKKHAEDAKVAIRHVRRDSNEVIKKAEKDKKISEDESHKIQEQIQKLTDQYTKTLDEKFAKKEKEVMSI